MGSFTTHNHKKVLVKEAINYLHCYQVMSKLVQKCFLVLKMYDKLFAPEGISSCI